MRKPIFLWWAHKEMWQIIASICSTIEKRNTLNDTWSTKVKNRAVSVMAKKYKNYNNAPNMILKKHRQSIRFVQEEKLDEPMYLCWACHAQLMLLGSPEQHSISSSWCDTSLCPIDWSAAPYYDEPEYSYGCLDTVVGDGIYASWANKIDSMIPTDNRGKYTIPASELATMISNLPLKRYANLLYEIEEYPCQIKF